MRRFILASMAASLFLVPSAAQAQVYGDPNSLVDYWYRTYLGRTPDPGMNVWVNALNQGVPADQALAGILGSDEYYARAGSTPEGFISRLYSDLLGRSPTPSEMNYWLGRMYVEDRSTIADTLLTQNPGVWVGLGTATPRATVAPGVIVTPPIESGWYRDWHRDRHWDWNWDRHHGVHEYRRPDIHHYHHDEHDEHHEHHH
jgi:hypothetical protein